ncbi:leucine--tRNA ligase [Chitinivibrio alkaliphilus]|uniref:Leucine--tRNA ligase n=1 Tax=Chitinivibrio alkaliphilus ACht1 TaxID=1313304 RepID=U7DBD7_9BACT|nr:leucine--tRNA ligase [Chitinivibrio alkaliphilus]ERP38873.1 leucyl-tRNA synthetase [Chitinivibrio alkaliphilus ACht1]
MSEYIPANIEKYWQDTWEKEGLFSAKTDETKEKKYILSMFPYPSGALHMGHVMNYTINDVVARYYMMKGYNVMTPIGWDSFGLPAENAAIRLGIHPSENIETNIARMKDQMKMAGWGFDWKRELATSSEAYYQWTQELFLRFYEKGLVEKKDGTVNWCPSCETVLANEQVQDGSCERCGTTVSQRDLAQWYFLMSQYAQKLLDGHKNCNEWPERVIKMQKEWIGRSEGATIRFQVEGHDESVEIYTTRPDTLWGVTFMSMAPQHPLVETLAAHADDPDSVLGKVAEMRSLGTSEKELQAREKEGVFTGAYAINPVNGDRIPIYVGNFVLMNYGTGIVMAVPTHDQRDFEFSEKYGITRKIVIQPEDASESFTVANMTEAYTGDGVLVDSGPFTGQNNRHAMNDIISWFEEKGYGRREVNFRLRDWLLSRQRYWGCPIPMIHCPSCGTVPVPRKDLPVQLPENVEFQSGGDSPLAYCEDFVSVACPECGEAARRETDTMDTFVDSSWYYLRFCSAQCDDAPFHSDEVNYWGPVDIYIGGIEHATMHLIYVRFFAQVLNEMGVIDFTEPAKKLFTQGMVCSTAHYCTTHKWLHESDVKDGTCVHCGAVVTSEVTKMSKTKLNVVDPEDIISKYGADTMRMYILSDTPPVKDRIWSEEGVHGIYRFIKRYWAVVQDAIAHLMDPATPDEGASDAAIRYAAHYALEKSIASFEENWQFNTAIARAMELTTTIKKLTPKTGKRSLREAVSILVRTVAPIIPHASEELWQSLGETGSIFSASYPKVDPSALIQDEVTIVVQVNGKMRGKFTAAKDSAKTDLEKRAFEEPNVQKFTEGATVRKVIVIPNKIVNIVVS